MGKLCLCSTINLILFLCRIFGCFPLSWKHVDKRCHYTVSKFWMGYSFLYLLMEIGFLSQYIGKITKPFQYDKKLLFGYINDINDNTATMIIMVFILLNMIRAKKMAKLLNQISSLSKYDLLCYSNLNVLRKLSIIFCSNFFILYLIQYSAILMLNLMDSFDTNWSHERLLMPIIQNTPLLLTGMVGCVCSVFITVLTCYERIMMLYLKFTPIHPLPGFDETNEKRTLLFTITYQRCKNSHKIINNTLDKLEVVEYLKYVYGQIIECIDLANDAFSPQLLIYITYEIIMMVFHWYAVIIFFTNENPDPSVYTLNAFNWLFVTTHSILLLLFLSKAQEVETMIKGLIYVLIEYSSRINTPEEYQQVRTFIENLKGRRGINASNVVNVNLGMTGPIAANILMYVLVAIQFRFPKSENDL